MLEGGHVLLEGVPGLAKTTTVKALADALAEEALSDAALADPLADEALALLAEPPDEQPNRASAATMAPMAASTANLLNFFIVFPSPNGLTLRALKSAR